MLPPPLGRLDGKARMCLTTRDMLPPPPVTASVCVESDVDLTLRAAEA